MHDVRTYHAHESIAVVTASKGARGFAEGSRGIEISESDISGPYWVGGSRIGGFGGGDGWGV